MVRLRANEPSAYFRMSITNSSLSAEGSLSSTRSSRCCTSPLETATALFSNVSNSFAVQRNQMLPDCPNPPGYADVVNRVRPTPARCRSGINPANRLARSSPISSITIRRVCSIPGGRIVNHSSIVLASGVVGAAWDNNSLRRCSTICPDTSSCSPLLRRRRRSTGSEPPIQSIHSASNTCSSSGSQSNNPGCCASAAHRLSPAARPMKCAMSPWVAGSKSDRATGAGMQRSVGLRSSLESASAAIQQSNLLPTTGVRACIIAGC